MQLTRAIAREHQRLGVRRAERREQPPARGIRAASASPRCASSRVKAGAAWEGHRLRVASCPASAGVASSRAAPLSGSSASRRAPDRAPPLHELRQTVAATSRIPHRRRRSARRLRHLPLVLLQLSRRLPTSASSACRWCEPSCLHSVQPRGGCRHCAARSVSAFRKARAGQRLQAAGERRLLPASLKPRLPARPAARRDCLSAWGRLERRAAPPAPPLASSTSAASCAACSSLAAVPLQLFQFSSSIAAGPAAPADRRARHCGAARHGGVRLSSQSSRWAASLSLARASAVPRRRGACWLPR
jgi:hypothetical protein